MNDNALKGESEKYKQQVKDLQQKITDLLQSKNKQAEGSSAAEMQIVELENKLMMVEEERSQAIEAQIAMKNEVAAMKDELKKKVNQLTQVTNMKKIITEKND